MKDSETSPEDTTQPGESSLPPKADDRPTTPVTSRRVQRTFNAAPTVTHQPVLPSRLLPRVSFRMMLILTTLSAPVIAMVSAADEGATYAIGVSAGLAAALALLVIAWLAFLAAWAFDKGLLAFAGLIGGLGTLASAGMLVLWLTTNEGSLFTSWIVFRSSMLIGFFLLLLSWQASKPSDQTSPFAEDQLPPQQIAPREQAQ
ncbi:MAG: hypothetical protein CBB71_15225 [Rhodopirellula sp. TMED11]|nr:MAG: hypothetical protein CBB71_15225 [Rhodopirellula sp. TMED11]